MVASSWEALVIIMRSFSEILEELTDAQIKQVNKWTPKNRDVSISKHVMGDKPRISIPMESQSAAAHPDVKNHLEQHGMQVKDYTAGTASDKYGREVKIGKALAKTKAPSHVINTFANDSARQAKSHSDLHVVVSNHPHDVAGMSTGRSWESCMTMDTGSNRDYLKHDIKAGTHVAYLTHKDDHEAKNPLARLALKPYTSKDGSHSVLRPETTMYGTGNDAFSNTVRKFSEDHFPLKEKTSYKPHKDLYDDTAHAATTGNMRKLYTHTSTIIKNSKETLDHFAKHGDVDEAQAVVHAGTQEHRDQLADHSNPHVRGAVADYGHPAHMEKLINDPHPFVRSGVALHGSDEHRAKLAGDKDATVRRAVAQHSETHHQTLMGDKSADVREAVARHSTNRAILGKLSSDPIGSVSQRAKAGIQYLNHADKAKASNKPIPDRDAY